MYWTQYSEMYTLQKHMYLLRYNKQLPCPAHSKRVIQMVEHLPSKWGALSSVCSTFKKTLRSIKRVEQEAKPVIPVKIISCIQVHAT
jgi:hypothetical protein